MSDLEVEVKKGGADDRESLKIDFRKRSFTGVFRVATFPDNEYVIAFLPSLNLTGYGNTVDEALDMLHGVVLKDYLDNLFTLPEHKLFNELRQHGWAKKPFLAKQLRNMTFIDREQIISNFNLPKETQISERYINA